MREGSTSGARGRGGVWNEKFRIMLRVIPAPDGGEWGGTKMESASQGDVSTTYFSALRDGRIETPRADKVEAIARAMEFEPGLWFKPISWWRKVLEDWEQGRGIGGLLHEEGSREDGRKRLAALLDGLFETRVDPETGEPFTEEGVARASGGALTAGDVRAMRAGELDPTRAQLLALGDVFGADPSYFFGRDEAPAWRPSPAVLEAARGRDSYLIFQNSLRLSDRDRSILMVLAESLKRGPESGETDQP